MPDTKKSIKFKKEQAVLITNLFNLLPLDDSNSFVRHDLEQNIDLQKQILDFIPDIKKYFNVSPL